MVLPDGQAWDGGHGSFPASPELGPAPAAAASSSSRSRGARGSAAPRRGAVNTVCDIDMFRRDSGGARASCEGDMETAAGQELDEHEAVALHMCEVNTASWGSLGCPSPWILGPACSRKQLARLGELTLEEAPRTVGERAGNDVEAEDAPQCPGLNFQDLNSESWSSRGSGISAAALNFCDINTASWSSRDSRSPWFALGACPGAPLRVDQPLSSRGPAGLDDALGDVAAVGSGAHGHDNACSWRSRGSAALNFCEVNTASWGSTGSRAAWLSACPSTRRPQARSVKELLEDFAWLGETGAAHSGSPTPGSAEPRDLHQGDGEEAFREESLSHMAAHLHDLNGCSWRSRGSAALNLCEVNTASWGSTGSRSAWLAACTSARRPVARSVKDLLEDFARHGGTPASCSEPAAASASSSAPPPAGGGGAGACCSGALLAAEARDAQREDGEEVRHRVHHREPALKRLEAGSIAALQAELAKGMHGPSSQHQHPLHIAGAYSTLPHGMPMMHLQRSKLGPQHLDHTDTCFGQASFAPQSVLADVRPDVQSIIGLFRFSFTVSTSKLESKEKSLVSELFHIAMGDVMVPFKVQVIAKHVHRHKHGQCFRTARGRGRLELKCEGAPPEGAGHLTFAFQIGPPQRCETARGPVVHDFLCSSVGRLPTECEEWDFRAAVGPGGSGCQVCLEVLPPTVLNKHLLPHSAAELGLERLTAQGADDLSFSPGGHLSTIAEDPPEFCT